MANVNYSWLILLIIVGHISACELSKSPLCALFDLENLELFCTLPPELQDQAAQKIMKQFPEAFSGWMVTKPTHEIKHHKDEFHRLLEIERPDIKLGVRWGVSDMQFIDGGNTLVTSSCDGNIAFWKLPECTLVRQLTITDETQKTNNKIVKKIEFSQGRPPPFSEPPEKKEFYEPREMTYRPCLLAFNHDESLLAVAIEMKVHVYNLKTEEKLGEIQKSCPIKFLSFIARTSKVLVDGDSVWDYVTGFNQRFLPVGIGIHQQVINSDRTRLATAVGDRTLTIWDLLKDPVVSLIRIDLYSQADDLSLRWNNFVFLDDETLLLSKNKTFFIVDLRDIHLDKQTSPYRDPFEYHTKGSIKARLHKAEVEAAAYRQKKKVDEKYRERDREITYRSMSYAQAANILCVAGKDRTVQLFDISTGKEIITFIDPSGKRDVMDSDQWDLSVKALIHPTMPLCFSLREMQPDEIYHPISVWICKKFPANRVLDIKRSLFIQLMSLLQKEQIMIKKPSAKVNTALPDLRLVSFPKLLREELQAIFKTFTPEQREFLRHVFFRNT